VRNNEGLSSNIGVSWIYNNTFLENTRAINIIFSGLGVYQNNTIKDNGYGIYVSSGDNNTFIDNNFINNSNGLYFSSSDYNIFYGNNFLHNTIQGYSNTGTNTADNGTFGNFWLDHLGIDNDSDGLLDTPYAVDGLGGVDDNFPLSIWNNETFNPEIINSPTNLTYETHSIGHNLTWRAIDESPYDYEVFFNGSSQGTNTFTSREFFNVSVDGFDLGETNVTVTFRDTDDNKQSNTIFVTVVDTIPPNLTSGKVFAFMEVLPDKSVNWTLTDLHPWNYTILLDSIPYENGSWINGEMIIVNVSDFTLGVYELVLIANDSSSNTNSSTHYVIIFDGTSPVVSQPSNTSWEIGYPVTPITWIASDNHPTNYTIFVNEIEYRSDNWTSEVPISLDFSNFTLGIYNITLIVYDISGLNANSTLFLTVLPDSTPPLITSPGNQTIMESTDIILSWLASDYNPTSYTIYENEIPITGGTWNSSVPIEYSITNASFGIYNYTLVVMDINNNAAIDTIFVTVEPIQGLMINHPENVTYVEGMINNWIYWTILSNSTGNYTIYRNSIPIETQEWTNSTLVDISVDNLNPGTYNYTIMVRTVENLTVNDTVFVDVLFDTVAPVISNESDIFILEMSTDNVITWTVSDLNPNIFSIFRNDSILISDSWAENITLTVGADNLHPGVWNFTCIIYDIHGLSAIDTVFVFVADISPPVLVNTPLDQIVEDATGLELSWRAIDYFPFNYSLILNNGTIITGYWSNNSWVNYTLTNKDLGEYIFTITFSDLFGHEVISTITIEVVDTTPPTIDILEDCEYLEGTSSFILNWNFTDKHNYSYIVYLEDETLTSGFSSESSSISVDVGNLPEGTYTITLVVTDYSGNQAIDNLVLTVNPSSSPTTPPPSTTVPSTTDTSSSTDALSSTTTAATIPEVSTGFEGYTLLIFGVMLVFLRKKKNLC
jgi:parallel beta-helix repeat protein